MNTIALAFVVLTVFLVAREIVEVKRNINRAEKH